MNTNRENLDQMIKNRTPSRAKPNSIHIQKHMLDKQNSFGKHGVISNFRKVNHNFTPGLTPNQRNQLLNLEPVMYRP